MSFFQASTHTSNFWLTMLLLLLLLPKFVTRFVQKTNIGLTLPLVLFGGCSNGIFQKLKWRRRRRRRLRRWCGKLVSRERYDFCCLETFCVQYCCLGIYNTEKLIILICIRKCIYVYVYVYFLHTSIPFSNQRC